MVLTIPLAVVGFVSSTFIPAGVVVLAYVTIVNVCLAIETAGSGAERSKASFAVIIVMGVIWWFFYLSHLRYIL